MGLAAIDELSEAIVRYKAAAELEGFKGPERIDDPSAIDEVLTAIQEVIAPSQLPEEIVWFWRNWDLTTVDHRITDFPDFCDPSFALDSYAYELWPKSMFPIGYQSHCSLAVELDYPGSLGRWLYFHDDSGFRIHAPSLAASFDALTETIEAADFEFDTDGSRFLLSTEVERRQQLALAEADIPAEELGPFSEFEILSWPRRWQHQQGIDASAELLRGPTHTVAELHEARRHGPAVATIRGQRGGGMSTTTGSLAVIADETGIIDVWIPISVPSLGRSPSGQYEFDVLAEQAEPNEPRLEDFASDFGNVQRLAMLGDIRAAADASRRPREHLRSHHPVVASAVRPITK